MSALKRLIGLDGFRYTYFQFLIFRSVLGCYLFVHFVMLIPYAPELFSYQGLIPDPSLFPTYRIFPNLLSFFDSPLSAQIFVSVLTLLSVFLLIGWKQNWVAFFLWYGWACLFNRNIFIGNPGLPFVGWILLALTLIPERKVKEKVTGLKGDSAWEFPPGLFWGAWLIMSFGYTLSGIHKLSSPSWVDGTAIAKLLENPLARDVPWREWLMSAPTWVTRGLTYGSLILEISFLPFSIYRVTRPWVWTAMIGMHLGILTLVSFADLTLGVLLIHAMTFDSRWLAPTPRKKPRELVLFFDGVCGLCSSVVDFVLSEDREERFIFSPLQSEYATQRLTSQQTQNLESLVLIEEGKVYEKSDAVIRIGLNLGGIYRTAGLFRTIPRSLRDKIYDYVAKHRYRWFGKQETCRLPTPAEKTRFRL